MKQQKLYTTINEFKKSLNENIDINKEEVLKKCIYDINKALKEKGMDFVISDYSGPNFIFGDVMIEEMEAYIEYADDYTGNYSFDENVEIYFYFDNIQVDFDVLQLGYSKPPNMSGHPDTWTPDESVNTEIELTKILNEPITLKIEYIIGEEETLIKKELTVNDIFNDHSKKVLLEKFTEFIDDGLLSSIEEYEKSY